MSYENQNYIVYLIVMIVFYLFTKPIWIFLFSLLRKKEEKKVEKNLYEHSCGKCKIKN
jgi:hypothetical protein